MSRAATTEQMWDTALTLTQSIGVSALNVASFSACGREVNWLRSSMDEAWLKSYTEQGFYDVDPLVINAPLRPPATVINAATLGVDHANRKALALNHELDAAGYATLFSSFLSAPNEPDSRMVVMSTDLKSDALFAAYSARELHQLSSVLAAFLKTPNGWQENGVFPVTTKRLSGREVDVLSLLAQGYRNDMIADRLHIAEVSVRKHLVSARKKLNASTREQALVTALRQGQITM